MRIDGEGTTPNLSGNSEITGTTGATAIRRDPEGAAAAYVVNATSNYRLGSLGGAEASAQWALKLDAAPHFPEVEYTVTILRQSRRLYGCRPLERA